jgi:tannase/feruloyl esterase
MVFDDPSYDIGRLNFDTDVTTTDGKVGAILNPDNPDLSEFKRRGGKLLHYHGWSDPVVPPRLSIAYYERVQAKMGDPSDFYRLFMAPGMNHCDSGRGPNVLPTLGAISAWVESGTPPDRLIAAKFVDNECGARRKRCDDSPSKSIERTRPLCPYPQRANWDGKGDRKSAESYRCAPGASRAAPLTSR